MFGTYQRLRVPVSASAREVIKAAHSKLSAKGLSREQRAARHAFLRSMLEYHKGAQELEKIFR